MDRVTRPEGFAPRPERIRSSAGRLGVVRWCVHHANHYYGHSHVLARWCGLDDADPPRIHGYLQHGWNIGDGMAPDHSFVPGAPLFVWSARVQRRAWSLGRRQVYAIGSPWAYLLALTPPSPDVVREGTIYYPFHGWEGQHVVGDHDGLIRRIQRVEDGPVTICLYWQEYRSRRLRRTYERAGFRVICHGFRGGWWKDLDPGFLVRQLAEQRRHKRVASNRLCSAVLYGTLAGCEPAVYGDPMRLEGERSAFGGQDFIERNWSYLLGPHVDVARARRAAADELGADRLLPPAALRRLLRWPAPVGAA